MSDPHATLQASLLELVTQTSTNLPPDVRRVMEQALGREEPGNRSSQALAVIARNIDLACEGEGPICQDTGWPTFEIRTPAGTDQLSFTDAARNAIAEATRLGKLRANSVDSITGKNTGNNLGPGMPTLHFSQWDHEDKIEVRLLLKGGGCENKNIQYSLPAELEHLGRADRTMEGIRKCILHAVWQAQGQGCSAGAIGVCIGGDRANGYEHAKHQLFRSLDDENPLPELAALESQITESANTLGIGTMGFGGNVTLLGCKIGVLNRLPASFFVSVAYDCWAFRRLGVVLDAKTGEIRRWLYRDKAVRSLTGSESGSVARTGAEKPLATPLSEEDVRALRVGDLVLLSGRIVTGRDAIHAHLMKHDAPIDLRGTALYHCGPVAVEEEGGWTIKAAGPTTSAREEPYQAAILGKFGIRAVIGKGGMGPRTLAGLEEHGAVYLNAVGGAAQYYARCIRRVLNVHLLEFGTPEAMWELEVEDFPAMVTMDAHGGSLHRQVAEASGTRLARLVEPVG